MATIPDILLKKHAIISDQMDRRELAVLLGELDAVLQRNPSGTIVEFGCYAGTTSLFISRLLVAYGQRGGYHVYDSFAGLPPKQQQDISPAGMQFVAGELSISKAQFIRNYRSAGLDLPTIHKGWFEDMNEADIPSGISFAFLDGDYYRSIQRPLSLITPQLLPGAVIVVDDYANEALPGARRAVDEWLVNYPACRVRQQSSLAVIHMP